MQADAAHRPSQPTDASWFIRIGSTVERGLLLTDASGHADLRLIRVIKCLRLLEHSCYSAEDLAGYFSVSKRTVYRDLRALVLAGVPLARAKRARDIIYHVSSDPPGPAPSALSQGG
jgi:hypothetical protein